MMDARYYSTELGGGFRQIVGPFGSLPFARHQRQRDTGRNEAIVLLLLVL